MTSQAFQGENKYLLQDAWRIELEDDVGVVTQ